MAERVVCRDDEVDEVLRMRERFWRLVAVVRDVGAFKDGYGSSTSVELRELYFERREVKP